MLRKTLFWLHLTAGTIAGLVILMMSVTGVLLTYERQMIAWADREYTSNAPSPDAAKLSPAALLEKIRESEGSLPDALTLHADPAAAAEATFGRERTVYADMYSGRIIGEGSKPVRAFFRSVTNWHRWFAAEGENRAIGRAVTGACNLAFLFLVMTGMYLWLPRKWNWRNVRSVLLFRGGLSGKARDFNWHNVIGIWSAVPLFFVVLGAVVISYPWATNLLYRITGAEPPAAAGSRTPGRTPELAQREPDLSGLDQAWARAQQEVPGWQTITFRVPGSDPRSYTFSIAESHRGRPDKRTTIGVSRATGEITQQDRFAEYSLGRKLRMYLRFVHTGEVFGVPGQTIAGLVSAGGAVLVWTGIALSCRRFRNWRQRKRASLPEEVNVNV